VIASTDPTRRRSAPYGREIHGRDGAKRDRATLGARCRIPCSLCCNSGNSRSAPSSRRWNPVTAAPPLSRLALTASHRSGSASPSVLQRNRSTRNRVVPPESEAPGCAAAGIQAVTRRTREFCPSAPTIQRHGGSSMHPLCALPKTVARPTRKRGWRGSHVAPSAVAPARIRMENLPY